MKKRILLLLMMCCLVISIMPMTIHAAQKETVGLMWTNTISFDATLTFNGTTGNVSVIVVGRSGVTNITADISLYYKNTSGSWIEIETDWEYDVDQVTLVATPTFTAVAGREYKIEVDATVTKGGYSEPISKTATATCPKK